ncbi:MAG: hypothetical protein ACMVP2_01145 [Imperialibacter sp.]|uniref:hypothetical protein n=1 Tax=Imperialibacter sp. TaxID=2038411 RepID=UPI003A882453
MGYIKEPEGVDFIIKSDPLTDEDRKRISKFISAYKEKSEQGKAKKTSKKKKKDGTQHVI